MCEVPLCTRYIMNYVKNQCPGANIDTQATPGAPPTFSNAQGGRARAKCIQEYLAYKKTHPPRTLP